MRVLVVYESMFGNTEQIAHAVAAGLAEEMEVAVAAVHEAPIEPAADVGLLVVGGPTHAFSMSRSTTRADALKQGARQGDGGIGLRDWLEGLPPQAPGRPVATFDTRVAKVRRLPGSAAKAAMKAVRRRGYEPAARPESFWVDDTAGPLLTGELDRARAWGANVAAAVTRSHSQS